MNGYECNGTDIYSLFVLYNINLDFCNSLREIISTIPRMKSIHYFNICFR